MPLKDGIVESVANSNFKNQAEMPMQYSNILLNDSLIAARNMTAIREKSVARSLERFDVTNLDEDVVPNVTASSIAQILTKLAQSTRPETGGA